MIRKTIFVYVFLLLSTVFFDIKLPELTFAPERNQPIVMQRSNTTALLSLKQKYVDLGDSADYVLEIFGEAQDVLPSEYGFSWYIFHDSYRDYIQIGLQNGRVVAIYTNSENFALSGICVGASRDDARLTLGEPVYIIDKPDARYRVMQDDAPAAEGDIFDYKNAYIHVFYDIFKNDSVTAIHIIDKDTELSFGMYGKPSQALAESFELQNFYVTNALRIREGKKALLHSEELSEVARSHALDMAEKDYFSHENQEGFLSHERISHAGIFYGSAGENLAMGSQNSLIMHEMLMNSEGHRNNILADYQFLGVGVAFQADGTPYLTQNYTAPPKIKFIG